MEGVVREEEVPGLEGGAAKEVGPRRVLRALHKVEVAHSDCVDIPRKAGGGAELGGLVGEVVVAC